MQSPACGQAPGPEDPTPGPRNHGRSQRGGDSTGAELLTHWRALPRPACIPKLKSPCWKQPAPAARQGSFVGNPGRPDPCHGTAQTASPAGHEFTNPRIHCRDAQPQKWLMPVNRVGTALIADLRHIRNGAGAGSTSSSGWARSYQSRGRRMPVLTRDPR